VWFDLQADAAPLGYQLGGWACLEHAIDVELERQAVSLIMARHDALRLRIDANMPRQRLEPSVAPPVAVTDLSQAEDPDEAFRGFAAQAFESSLPLGDAPLFHIDLVRAGAARWYVLWRCHHLITDAISIANLLARWSETYAALAGESDGELAPGTSFVGLLRADAAYEASPRHEADLAYWRERFSKPPARLFAPRPRAPAAPPEKWSLSGPDYHAFVAACRGCGVTTQRGLLAVLAIVLARMLSRRDIAIGLTLHRRDFATRDVIGMLAGVLPVRCGIDPSAALADNVKAIGAVLDHDFRHQRVALDALGRALGHTRALGELFDVVISHLSRDAIFGPRESSSEMYRGPEMTPLALYATEHLQHGCIEFELNANPGFVDAPMCRSLAAGLRRAITAFVETPELPADDFDPLDETGLSLTVSQAHGPKQAFPAAPLASLFAQQVARTPHAEAVSDGGRTLTYAQLDAASDALATALQVRGVTIETVIGVALHRSLETVLAMLAILKAGGVYLPLDPAYPPHRVAFMLHDARAALVVTDAALGAILLDDVPQLRVDHYDQGAQPRSVALQPGHLAYIIYTSGSTGAPKGVAVSHAAVANLAFARRAGPEPTGPGDRVLAASSTGFDVSIGQLLLPLFSGACVVIAPHPRMASARSFWSLVAEQRITHVDSVPSFVDSVSDAPIPENTLRHLMLGGEVVSGALCRRLSEKLSRLDIVNMYGPTEACIDATFHPVPTDASDDPLPIGRPLANIRAHVLDARLRPMPPGLEGELFLGGPGLARGYIGQPGLTSERFLADPFGPPGARLYRTGDRASWRADGTLAFHGRGDAQIKLRGFRIEPGEIESALRGHQAIAQAAVAVHRGSAVLVAYVVADGDMPDIEALRAHLAARLPAHMVPAIFVPLDALPLTPNGKLDRNALPAPNTADNAPYVPPAGKLESQLAGMFERLLGAPRVGAGDDFFALGGHSLLATRLVSMVRAECGIDVPLRDVFANPTVGALAAAIAAQRGKEALPALVSMQRPAAIPLSFAQERLWFLDQLDPEARGYVIAGAVRLTGPLDADALAAALHRVVARHESLRTRFATSDGRAIQIVDEAATVALERHDLTALTEAERDAAVRRFAAEAEREPFVLAAGGLLRSRLLILGPNSHVLVLAVHHIVADGWSLDVLFGELTALYTAFAHGLPDPLPPLPVQYADYALWQRTSLTGPVLEQLLAYWCEALEGAPDFIDLPLDVPRPPTPSLRGALGPWRASPALAARLRARAQEAGATLFMLLLTAFQALLARWSSTQDIIVGTPIAQRTRAETEKLIGFFVNTLALRADFSGRPRFSEALARTRESTLGAYTHQDLPFEKLVESLQPARDLGRQPIVQIMFALQNMGMSSVDLPGQAVEPLDLPVTVAKFDLTLTISESEAGLKGGFEYATDLFAPATIERLGNWFTRLLVSIADDPSLPLDDFDLLDEHERSMVVSDWNATATEFPSGPLTSLFAAQVTRTPALEAVIDGDHLIRYGQLDAASDALAALLQARGVTVETVVGVALHRSTETIVALLAILKAGGVYLPLDPAYPPERLAYMLRDAGAALVLTDVGLAGRLPTDVPQLGVDDNDVDYDAGERPLPVVLRAENLAYIVYTSGSTGAPKGVAVSHKAAANVAFARCAGHDPIGPGDRVLAAISVGFDVSIGQLLLPLLSGACVVIAPDLRALSAAEFWSLIAERRVTHINSVPSFFDSVCDGVVPPTQLRRLMLGGEVLTGALCRRLRAALPCVEIVNMYGPTETCIDATAFLTNGGLGPQAPSCEARSRVTGPGQSPGLPSGPLPIGRPLANYSVYVLDSRLRPLPPGVTGDLFLGGAGLARGYIGQPVLTASRFIADPFGPPGGRLYRTGDRASWRDDGVLLFHGRGDDQIKIRGFRVEPGEIEAALRGHPCVSQAAVAVHQGGTRLVGYIVPSGAMPEAAELRAHLAARLPTHMVPAVFVPLDALPLTRNGKLDRNRLPAPVGDGATIDADATPVGDREVLLCGLFAELTGATSVSRHDDFFGLGGDSIGVIRLVSLARTRGGISIQVRDVFAYPNPASLALVARAADPAAAPDVPATGQLLPTPLQHALLADGAPIARFHQFVALHPPAGLDTARISRALNRLVQEHPVLRIRLDGSALSIPDDGPPPVLRHFASEDPTALEARVRALSSEFDLGAGISVAGLHAGAGNGPALLALAIHHFAVDGVSWRILMEDFTALCASDDPVTARLPAPSMPFRGWTEYLHAEAARRAGELPIWQAMLAPGAAALPADHAAVPGANIVGTARTLFRVLPADATARLLTAPAVYRAEINDLLLAALGLALAAWQHDTAAPVHVVALEGHGREAGETGFDLTRTVGWFTSVYPVRLDFSEIDIAEALAGGQAAGETIKRVKATLRHLPDHGLGFGLLRHLNAQTGPILAALQQPELLFNYLGRFAQEVAGEPGFWRQAPLAATPDDDAGRPRDPVTLEANALLGGDGALHVAWTYAPERFDAANVARLAEYFTRALESLARHCAETPLPPLARLIPADFPLAEAAGLDARLLAELARAVPDLESVVPLTPLQHGLAFETLMREAGDDPYHVQSVLRLEGDVAPAALRAGLLALLRRHEVLRLAVPRCGLENGLGVLRPAAALLDWRELDWRDRNEESAEHALGVLMHEDRAAGFDLATGPLFRVTLIRRDAQHMWLVTSNHHAVLDGWSMPVLMGELFRLCEGVALPPTLPWQEYLRWLHGGDRAQAAAFWAEQYRGLAADAGTLRLPRAETETQGMMERTVCVPAQATSSLQTLARRLGVTIATLMLGAWSLTLRPLRATIGDLMLGVVNGGRPAELPGSDLAVGLFIQTLPLRVAMDGNALLEDWLRALQNAMREQEAHGWLGLPAIRRAAGLAGGRSTFDALFVFENYPVDPAASREGAPIRLVGASARDATHYPLALAAYAGTDDLRLRLSFDRGSIAEPEAHALLARLQTLLTHLALHNVAGTRIEDLPVGAGADRAMPDLKPGTEAVWAPATEFLNTPRDAIELTLHRIWQEVLGMGTIGLLDDFFDLGGDSLLAIRMIGACNTAFGVALRMSALFENRTIAAMANAIRGKHANMPTPRLVTLRAGVPGVLPLLCVHPHGGTAFCYAPLAAHLPPSLPVLGLQAAGLDEGEAPAASVAAMAADYIAAVREVQPTGPYRLLGYSFGGLVAYEMGRQLLADGERVSFLGLLDAPLLKGKADLPLAAATQAEALAMLADEIGLAPSVVPHESVTELFAAASAAGLVPPYFSSAQAERIAAVHFNTARIAAWFEPAETLALPALQVRAMQSATPAGDWSPFLTGPVETHDLDCTHRGMIAADTAPLLAAIVEGGLIVSETIDG
jgi:amino acid adenylation domain-containing protein/non-ribosomal peptide synthase protein (TIGR01720 family)